MSSSARRRVGGEEAADGPAKKPRREEGKEERRYQGAGAQGEEEEEEAEDEEEEQEEGHKDEEGRAAVGKYRKPVDEYADDGSTTIARRAGAREPVEEVDEEARSEDMLLFGTPASVPARSRIESSSAAPQPERRGGATPTTPTPTTTTTTRKELLFRVGSTKDTSYHDMEACAPIIRAAVRAAVEQNLEHVDIAPDDVLDETGVAAVGILIEEYVRELLFGSDL